MLDSTVPSSHSSSTALAPETPKAVNVPTILPSKTSTGDDTGALPSKVLHLQGEMNMAIGQLLMTRASMDACHRKQVSDTKASFCKNEAQKTEAIQEAKAQCTTMVQEAEATCATAIQEVETTCADHAHTLQQAHKDSMEGLEREGIKEEKRDCQSFLTACGVALQVFPPRSPWVLMYPLQLLMGNMSFAALLAISPNCPPQCRNLPLQINAQPHQQSPHPFCYLPD